MSTILFLHFFIYYFTLYGKDHVVGSIDFGCIPVLTVLFNAKSALYYTFVVVILNRSLPTKGPLMYVDYDLFTKVF